MTVCNSKTSKSSSNSSKRAPHDLPDPPFTKEVWVPVENAPQTQDPKSVAIVKSLCRRIGTIWTRSQPKLHCGKVVASGGVWGFGVPVLQNCYNYLPLTLNPKPKPFNPVRPYGISGRGLRPHLFVGVRARQP